MSLCRAIATQTGDEAFAINISRESPFKPRRADRAELSKNAQREVQWYRSTLPGQPEVQFREALIELSEDRVAHVHLRVGDQAALERYQQLVAELDFAARPLHSNAGETASAPTPAAESPQTEPEIDPTSFTEEADTGEEQETFEASSAQDEAQGEAQDEAQDEPQDWSDDGGEAEASAEASEDDPGLDASEEPAAEEPDSVESDEQFDEQFDEQ